MLLFVLLVQKEVFNFLFLKQKTARKTFHVYCQECALAASAKTLDGFSVLFQYEVDELMAIYDQFRVRALSSQRKSQEQKAIGLFDASVPENS